MSKPRKPCAGCGGDKMPGRGQVFCAPCKERPRFCGCGTQQTARHNEKGQASYYCTQCVVQRATERRKADPSGARIALLARKFKITEQAVRDLEARTGGECPLCGEVPSGSHGPRSVLNLDHDHATGKPRAFICSPCNQAIGLVRERPMVLLRMVAYLTEHHPSLAAMVLPEGAAWTIPTSPTFLSSTECAKFSLEMVS